MENDLKDFKKVYHMLEDDVSRDIYLNRLNYLISSDRRYIDHIVAAHIPELPLFKKQTIADLVHSMPTDREIVLYGAGGLGNEALKYFSGDKRFAGFCSRTLKKQQNGYLGYPCMSPKELLSRKDLSVVVCASGESHFEIDQMLKSGNYPQDLVYDLRPYCGVLSDPKQYFGEDFITYGKNEVFVDAGCYTLYSSLTLRRLCKNLKKVYAFEPDPANYQYCLKEKERTNFEEAEIFPYGTWSTQTTLLFDATGNGSARISQNSNEEVQSIHVNVVPIDNVITPGDKITFIKMDVEGSELESLKGAKQTIQRDKPKLAICIYHKPEDMTTIPLYIKELVSEYKLYVRHHSNGAGETVLYAIMS